MHLGEGVTGLGGVPFDALAGAWRKRPPVFVRHVCPVHVSRSLCGERGRDVATIEEAGLEACRGNADATLSFSVQTRLLIQSAYKPYEVGTRLATAVSQATGAVLDVRAPRQVLSVVVGPGPSVYAGWSRVEDNLSNWAGGMRRFARESGQVSRAEFKLLEALEVFGVVLVPQGEALDLGAAPGGWTRVLRARGLRVTAVDPAELDPSVQSDPGVRHERTTAEQFIAAVPAKQLFSFIGNDMRQDARDSARVMVSAARLLAPEGVGVMTCKLAQDYRSAGLEAALAILRKGYRILGARHLFHNRSEVTVALGGKE